MPSMRVHQEPSMSNNQSTTFSGQEISKNANEPGLADLKKHNENGLFSALKYKPESDSKISPVEEFFKKLSEKAAKLAHQTVDKVFGNEQRNEIPPPNPAIFGLPSPSSSNQNGAGAGQSATPTTANASAPAQSNAPAPV